MSNYESILETITSRIKDDVYPVGTTVPTELELCEELSASRYAVRKAIKSLRKSGLVTTRRRAGTVVLRREPSTGFGLHLETTDELDRYDQSTNLYIENVVDNLIKNIDQIDLKDDLKDWFLLETYRTVPNTLRPISWSNIYIRKDYKNIVEHITPLIGGIFPLFSTVFNEEVGKTEIEISATNFPKRVAKHLNYLSSDPALLIIRRCRNLDGKILAVAESYYPPYEFRYTINRYE